MEVCNFSCQQNHPRFLKQCYTNCLININKSPQNQKATTILSFLVRKLSSITESKNLSGKGKDGKVSSVEEEIEEKEEEVGRMKKSLLGLEEEVLMMRKRKAAELAQLKHKKIWKNNKRKYVICPLFCYFLILSLFLLFLTFIGNGRGV